MATYQELRTRSQQVRDEQNIGGNTALRVGQLLMDIVKYFNDNDEAASEYLQQHFAMVNDGTQLLNWQQSPIVILHTMGETYDDGDFSALSQGENYYRAGFVMEANGQGGGINGETPRANVLYVNLANDTLYTWNGSSFDAITSGGGGGSISGDDIIKNAYYSNGNLVLIIETEGGDKTVTIPVNFDASNYVPTSRTVNGKALSNNITLSQSDIPGLVAALAALVPQSRTINEKPLTGNVTIGMNDIPGLGTAIGEAGKVKSVSVNNGTPAQPDSNGNVNVVVPTLTLDNEPTEGSPNAVKSGGVKQAIDDKLTEVVVNEISGAADIITIDDADLAFTDEDGNIAMQVAEGHVETANFNSRQVATNTANIQQLQSQIGQQGSVQTDVVVKEDADAAFDIADASGKVALRITSKGHIKTKCFDSENMDIFRATKLDSPQCVCHGYGSVSGQANSLTYFRNGLAKGYKFFEVDGVDCRDGVTVCTHSYSTYSVKNKSTGETESIVFSEIDSTDLLTNYTWPNDEPIAMLKDVIWLICYFHRCPLHVDGQGMTKASRYAASAYAESLGVGQYVFHELSSGIYNDWDIPCNAIVDCGNIGNQIAANKKSNNNIIFYFASNFFQSEEHLKSLADTIHAGGCYLMSWTFSNIDTIRTWFRCGADFLITSGKTNNEV